MAYAGRVNDARPSPETMLKAARRAARGRLKIFLGAAPGVGKTYEMLREGADLLRAGQDVVVGVVETHGRAETAELLLPFEVLPRRDVEHGAHRLREMDIDALLARAPAVALVDELAHSNAPGSRHPKRWQDIEELRDAGIDVLTTVNIQHIESLNDVVAGFTKVRVRETVPDAILDDAEIEIVDLPPDELIERLKAGKVYVPEEASRALGHFFSRPNLSALRELALRRAAQSVDLSLLEDVGQSGGAGAWAAGDRLVVAIGDQPGTEMLVRAAKRLADALHAPWTAVSVETPRSQTLGEPAREHLASTLQLASGLGASLATVPARSVLEGLVAHVRETRATAIVIGKTRRSRWFELRHGSVVDELVRTLDGVAVHVVPIALAPGNDNARARPPLRWRGIWIGLGLIALTTLLAQILQPVVGASATDLLYLLPVITTATMFGLRPSLVASLAAALAYNFFFLPPIHTLTVSDPQNVVTLLVLIIVAVVSSNLAGRLKREATVGARTATDNAALAAFGQRLASVSDAEGTANAVCEEIAGMLHVSTILLARRDGAMRVAAATPPNPNLGPLDMAAAEWAQDRGEVAGRDSSTLNAAEWQFHPLQTSLGVLAVVGVADPAGKAPVPPDRRLLFTTLLGQSALAHERLKLEAEARESDALKQRDNLRATLLSSLGHDLKTPLTAMVAAADSLAAQHGASPVTDTLRAEARRLRRLFDDLVEMTRIEAGAMHVRAEPTDLTDSVAAAAHDLRSELAGRRVVLDVPPSLPLVDADPRMLHHILINLLGNAAKYAPAGSAITVKARRDPNALTLAVLDEGPGLPPGSEDGLFDRFARVDMDDRAGTGLGLAIVKGFAAAMGLEVSAENRPEGGARFAVIWPASAIRPPVRGDA